MSRGGRGGKRTRPQIRAKGEDEDGQPLMLTQPKPEDFQPPPLYPPLPSHPQPFTSTSTSTSHYLHTARLLFDSHSYSGYRLSVEQKESVRLERYSDRYRRRPGQRTFLDDCPHPSLFLFPAELQKWGRGSRGQTGAAGSKWASMSAEALQSHLDRLTVVRDDTAAAELGTAASMDGALKEERKDGSTGAGDGDEKDEEGGRKRAGDDDDEDEEEEEEEREDDEDDDMGGGDYTDKYQEDDDGEGDDVFGDDGDGDVF